jgi:hypothetical protein
VSEPHALLLLAIHPAQQRVHVDERDRTRTGQQRRTSCELDQELAGDGLELTDVAMAEHAQERSQRRGRIHTAEQLWHATVAHYVQIIDAVGPGEHSRHDRGDLVRSVGSLIGRDMKSSPHDAVQVARFGQPHHRFQACIRHEGRIIERCPDRRSTG